MDRYICKAKCIYCDFYSVADRNNEIPDFINSICKEIDLFFKTNKYIWDFDTIFFGGGTPSLLKACSIESILNTFEITGLRKSVSTNNTLLSIAIN